MELKKIKSCLDFWGGKNFLNNFAKLLESSKSKITEECKEYKISILLSYRIKF